MPSDSSPNTRRLTITATIIMAAGLAAGVALARPATSVSAAGAEAVATGQAVAVPGYGTAAPPAVVQVPPAATAITIRNFDFGSPEAVAPGSVITITNADGTPHTLTFSDGSVDTGTLEAGASISIPAPTAAGTYTFFCAIHPTMTGQLTVSTA